MGWRGRRVGWSRTAAAKVGDLLRARPAGGDTIETGLAVGWSACDDDQWDHAGRRRRCEERGVLARLAVTNGVQPAFPQARPVPVAKCPTQMMFDVAIAPYTRSETVRAALPWGIGGRALWADSAPRRREHHRGSRLLVGCSKSRRRQPDDSSHTAPGHPSLAARWELELRGPAIEV